MPNNAPETRTKQQRYREKRQRNAYKKLYGTTKKTKRG